MLWFGVGHTTNATSRGGQRQEKSRKEPKANGGHAPGSSSLPIEKSALRQIYCSDGEIAATPAFAATCSAGFQPAVSRVSNPQNVRKGGNACLLRAISRLEIGDTAGRETCSGVALQGRKGRSCSASLFRLLRLVFDTAALHFEMRA
jgi:hypothetical protein